VTAAARSAPAVRVFAAAVACALAACAPSARQAPVPSGPSGSLGVVTIADADRAVAALCGIAARRGPDVDGANATFYDDAHQTLHVIAAATDLRDRGATAVLQQDMGVVEEDLRQGRLPQSFVRDIRALIGGTRAALSTDGIATAPC
jgi:hypothetical protein